MSVTLNLDQIKEAIIKYDFKDSGITANLVNIYTSSRDLEDFCEILGEVALCSVPNFMKNQYFFVQKKLKKELSVSERVQMDRQVVEKYCLLPEEKLIASWKGDIHEGRRQCVGRIFLTNYRIICTGHLFSRSKSILTLALDAATKKFVLNAVSEYFGDNDERLFGTFYPIKNIQKINKKKKSMYYTSSFEYESKGRQRKAFLSMSVLIHKEPGEDKTSHLKRCAEILDIFEEILKDNKL